MEKTLTKTLNNRLIDTYIALLRSAMIYSNEEIVLKLAETTEQIIQVIVE